MDDDEQHRALAQAVLDEENFHVELARNGLEAITLFERRPPDCVLLDVRMPGMDGIETCRRLRAFPGAIQVPILFLTASRDVDTFDATQLAGGNDFVTKPVHPTELLLRVQMALRLRRLQGANKEYIELARRERDELVRLQLQKEQLSSFVVHDLKSPVGTIDLLARLLQRDERIPLDARESVDAIRNEVSSLLQLILNLLDISRSDEGRLVSDPSVIELNGLVSALLDSVELRAEARGIRLRRELDGVTHVAADPALIRRVLENLLDNALRYAPKSSSITVSVKMLPREVEVRVADQGQGIPVELREQVFDRFVQLRNDVSARRTNRGLGLTFCRSVIEAHRGRIFVEDAEPGAAFCIRLPLANAA